MLKIGCCEHVLDVPLFAELYGYGPFAGRRNRGIHDPLFCRTVTFSAGGQRTLIVYTDTCVTSDLLAQMMRARLASVFCLDPHGVAFVATHTHSAPLLGNGGVGSGEQNAECEQTWENAAIKIVAAALADEEEIFEANAGKSLLAKPLGKNRAEPGMELMQLSGADFPFVATVSNGNGAYLFTAASALRYPNIASKSKQLFGYYELYGYMHALRFKYRNDIAAFVIRQLLQQKDF